MSNTFKFGNGKWATGQGSVLAYNDENNNFKPLPFNFTRASSATRVDENGLIEVVGSNEPRIDYLNNADGHLLLEPSRTNLFTYSNDFSDSSWAKSNLSVSESNGVWEVTDNTTSGSHYIFWGGTVPASTLVTLSVEAKAGSEDYLAMRLGGFTYAFFDLRNGTLGSVAQQFDNATITPVGNGYYKCTATITTPSSGNGAVFYPTDNGSQVSYTGTNSVAITIRYAQLEQGSYATSYIPTSGSAVTRAADGNEQNPPSGIIGQTEGTIFLDADLYKKSDTEFYIAISDTTLSNSIYLHQSSQDLLVNKRISGATQTLQVTSANWSSGRNKCAIKYTTSEMKIFINGVLKDTESISGLPSGLSNLTVGSRQDQIGVLSSNSHYREVKLYNTALTDAELIALTS